MRVGCGAAALRQGGDAGDMGDRQFHQRQPIFHKTDGYRLEEAEAKIESLEAELADMKKKMAA